MVVKTEYNCFEDYTYHCWGGALVTLWNIKQYGVTKELEFVQLMNEEFPEGTTDAELNDYIWSNPDQIYNDLGIDPYEEEEDEEEDDDYDYDEDDEDAEDGWELMSKEI